MLVPLKFPRVWWRVWIPLARIHTDISSEDSSRSSGLCLPPLHWHSAVGRCPRLFRSLPRQQWPILNLYRMTWFCQSNNLLKRQNGVTKWYLQYVVECNVLGDMSIGYNQFDVVGTVYAGLMPEDQQGLKRKTKKSFSEHSRWNTSKLNMVTESNWTIHLFFCWSLTVECRAGHHFYLLSSWYHVPVTVEQETANLSSQLASWRQILLHTFYIFKLATDFFDSIF